MRLVRSKNPTRYSLPHSDYSILVARVTRRRRMHQLSFPLQRPSTVRTWHDQDSHVTRSPHCQARLNDRPPCMCPIRSLGKLPRTPRPRGLYDGTSTLYPLRFLQREQGLNCEKMESECLRCLPPSIARQACARRDSVVAECSSLAFIDEHVHMCLPPYMLFLLLSSTTDPSIPAIS
ncbi:hypothetical protein C8F01DRAFT_470306 [Mycena amicta]|nr:hypothetical protein C8F01DRAFT_470306 [Mycena amicta]